MATHYKTFTVIVPLKHISHADVEKLEQGDIPAQEKLCQEAEIVNAEAISDGFTQLDKQVNDFVSELHWSQCRAHEDKVVERPSHVILTRTLAYVDEKLVQMSNGQAGMASRPPV